MTKNEVKKRIEKLREEIEDLRYRYHVKNEPGLTDEVYTALTKELRDLEEAYPEFQSPTSPTVRIGGVPLDKFKKIKHASPMLSLNDVFSYEELSLWEERIQKLLPGKKFSYFCELKFDGLAISLIYNNGELISGATRGDGSIGEDVTLNIKTIHTIPLILPDKKSIEIRGEVLMGKKTLIELNKKQERLGKTTFANTRNAAAGSLRQLDPKIAASRRLDFFAYDLGQSPFLPEHSAKHDFLRKLRFKTSDLEKKCASLDEVFKFIERVSKKRESLPFGIDGIVVSVNETDLIERLGVVGKAPRGVAAFKYPPEKTVTIVKDIFVNVGRTGVLTPVAVFEPVSVAGSTISHATLHNIDQIERLDVRIGDTVVIQKAGDVIPAVVEVIKNLRTGKEHKFKMPTKCPVCSGKVEKDKKLVAYYCTNPKCLAKNRRFMQHFVNVLEIYEVGPKILDRFSDEGLISDVADLFTLKKEDVAALPRFGEKSAENIIASIESHKKIPLWRFLYALGILHVGDQTARDMAIHFGTLDKIIKANLHEINEIENIGPVVSLSVYDYFQDKRNLEFIKKLQKNGISIVVEHKKTGKFEGRIFVITGTLEKMSREDAKKRIIDLGGRVASAVTKNTNYLVVGQEPGRSDSLGTESSGRTSESLQTRMSSKLKEAEKLGTKILSEKDFLALLAK